MEGVKSRLMSLLQAYLHNPKTKNILNRKPGEAGFSLIELVVVVAVLAILSAIAIPSFTSINKKARASAATNTIATVVKDCAVKYANGEANPTFAAISLDGYTSFNTIDSSNNASTTACLETGTIRATSSDTASIPTFNYDIATGAKTCSMTGSPSAAVASAVGCKNFASGAGVW